MVLDQYDSIGTHMHLQNGGQNSKMKHFHEMNRRWIWFFFQMEIFMLLVKKKPPMEKIAQDPRIGYIDDRSP